MSPPFSQGEEKRYYKGKVILTLGHKGSKKAPMPHIAPVAQ